MQNFSPLLLLTDAEQKIAIKLLFDRQRYFCSADELNAQHKSPALLKKLAKYKSVKEQILLLAENVLARELGLKKYMVIQIDRASGFSYAMQVTSIDLELSSLTDRWDWRLCGFKCKKDNSVGKLHAYIPIFGETTITRRMLDGTWKILTRRETETVVCA